MTLQAEDTWTPCDAKALLSGKGVPTQNPQTQTQTLALDAGRQAELETVALETWHVQEFGGSKVSVATNGQLHEGESYIVRWTYTAGGDRKEKTAYFLWQGRHSSVGGQGTATFLSLGLKSEEDSQGAAYLWHGCKAHASAREVGKRAVECLTLFLLDNRLEVYLWQRGPLVAADSACIRWANERRCAMQTTLQYCKELNPRRPPMAYLISEGAEPLTFTNVFPRWERRPRPATQADPGQAKLVLVQDALAQLPTGGHQHPGGTDPQGPEVFLPDQEFQAVPEAESEQYESLAAWKQGDAKTGEGLYV
ncbi:hypothetical protein CRUP_014278 [Coryphaenoides rupestris]|nr:hypothetical protein CRUP_014278 [Coryphaenoides rupestris]